MKDYFLLRTYGSHLSFATAIKVFHANNHVSFRCGTYWQHCFHAFILRLALFVMGKQLLTCERSAPDDSYRTRIDTDGFETSKDLTSWNKLQEKSFLFSCRNMIQRRYLDQPLALQISVWVFREVTQSIKVLLKAVQN